MLVVTANLTWLPINVTCLIRRSLQHPIRNKISHKPTKVRLNPIKPHQNPNNSHETPHETPSTPITIPYCPQHNSGDLTAIERERESFHLYPFITIDVHELKCLLDAIKIVSFRKIIVATSSSQASRRRLQAALQPAEGLLPLAMVLFIYFN